MEGMVTGDRQLSLFFPQVLREGDGGIQSPGIHSSREDTVTAQCSQVLVTEVLPPRLCPLHVFQVGEKMNLASP